ncbi:MAG: PAS domain-containing protein [Nitrospinae bacterium]|nr:PAS domain-containing protein [Nitrospinota bacterium]
MNRYTANDAPRILIVEGNQRGGEAAAGRIAAYFEKRSIPITCDWVNSVERSLVQVRYYDYDAAVVAMHPQPDESGVDFIELMEQRHYRFPVLLIAPPDGGAEAAEEAFRRGAAGVIVRGEHYLDALPEAVDNAILQFRARREQEKLADDVREKNKELRALNDILARQSVRFLKLKKEQESQRRRMESLLNAMSDGVVFVNSRREIEMLNPAARAIFRTEGTGGGFSLDDLKAFTGIDPFDRRAEDETPAAIFSVDYHVAARIVEEDGAQTGRMVVLRNVTQEKEVERLKAEFQSMVSHELRTPLTAIRGAVENFLRGTLGGITEQQRVFLTMILRNVERQTLLINDMLDLAKLEANMMSLKAAQMEPEYAARLSHESFRYACAEKGVTLTLILTEGLPKIYADERMVCQILDNLLSNALKFTPNGGTISLEAVPLAEPDPAVAFRVIDSGIGVPDHLKEKIFDRYFQADSSIQRQYKGTGLGLAICRKMAELHNGTVTAADAPGGGAVFTLRLPVSLALRKKIVLAVADPGQRGRDEEVLRREFHCITAVPGDNVPAKIAETLPQLVIIDYLGDGMNGFGIYGDMKKNPATARIPVIFLGDGLTEGDKVQALKAGAADVITRPYNAGEFLARVKRTAGGAA